MSILNELLLMKKMLKHYRFMGSMDKVKPKDGGLDDI